MAKPALDRVAGDAPTGLRIAMVGQGNFTIPAKEYAPVENHIACLVEALRARGEEVHLVNRVLPRFRFRLLAHALWVHLRLRRLRPDVIHCHSPINVRILRLLGHRPVVFTSHSREWMRAQRGGEVDGSELRNHQRAWRLAHERIALSGQARKAILATPGLAHLPVHVVPNGVDPLRFSPPGQRDNGPTLVGIGVVARVKRWHLAARAIQGTGWRLRIIGPIRHQDYADGLRSMPGVHLAGAVSDEELLEALRAGHLLVHPSQAEAMSLAVLEGMATGLAVLASPAVADMVEDGASGRIVPEGDEQDMVRMFHEHLRDTPMEEWQRMGRAARAWVVRNSSWAKVAEATLQVYRAAAAQAPR